MKYFALDKRLVIPIHNLLHIFQNSISKDGITQESIMTSLVSEMVTCGCHSISDGSIPEINRIEILMDREDTIGYKSKRQNYLLRRKGCRIKHQKK